MRPGGRTGAGVTTAPAPQAACGGGGPDPGADRLHCARTSTGGAAAAGRTRQWDTGVTTAPAPRPVRGISGPDPAAESRLASPHQHLERCAAAASRTRRRTSTLTKVRQRRAGQRWNLGRSHPCTSISKQRRAGPSDGWRMSHNCTRTSTGARRRRAGPDSGSPFGDAYGKPVE